jgi:hypothetical protein
MYSNTHSFYEWRKPTRTAAVLGVLALAVLATALTPLWLLIKLSTFSAGFTFFCLFPLSVNVRNFHVRIACETYTNFVHQR